MAISRGGGGANVAATADLPIFPLAIHASGRYLVDASARPFLIHGDTCWSIVGQLTDAEIDAYVDDRYAKGFNAILFSAPEPYYTSQTPAYNNVDGVAPFTTMSPVNFAAPNETYWTRVDRVVNRCKARSMVCVVNPAYLGYASGADGWYDAIDAESSGDLQTYGAWLANRYTQGNVIWSLGGDQDNSTIIAKQANILTGIRSVRTSDVVTAHPLSNSGDGDDAYTYWSAVTGFNLNWIYGYESTYYVYDLAAQAYGRSGPVPFVGFEFKYENATDTTTAMLRRQSYGSLLSGACGQFYGALPIWNFESSRWSSESWTGSWESHLNDTGCLEQAHAKALFKAFSWWLLVPKTDTSLVSSSLGSGATRLYPALASDGTFAMIYVPSSQTVTVVTTALSGVAGNVRIRLFDPTSGTYSTNQASIAKSSGQSVATGGERVIVVDAA